MINPYEKSNKMLIAIATGIIGFASVVAIASTPGYAAGKQSSCTQGTKCYEEGWAKYCDSKGGISNPNGCDASDAIDTDWGPPPTARVTVAPPYQGPPPIGWVYGPYTMCRDPLPQTAPWGTLDPLVGIRPPASQAPGDCSMGVVNVPADGLNVRVTPNGPPVMSLVNGTPLIPLQRQGDWLLVAPACDLTPTWAWSWNAGVPLNRCWVYF
jgi:hypothetical protein